MARVSKYNPNLKDIIKFWINNNKEILLGGLIFIVGITCLIISSLAIKIIME